MNSIMISVIVPVYNTEKYLSKCIESIIDQTYDHFEIILVDDGSTDESGNICKRFVQKDSRVKYFYQDNTGAGMARNLGIENSNGEYITFVDSDDWIDSDYLEKLAEACSNCDIVQIGNHVYTSNGVTNRYDQINESMPFESGGRDTTRLLLEGKYPAGGVPWGKLYRKGLWNEIRFSNYRRFEDVDALYKIYWNAAKIRNIKIAKYGYRSERPDSIMHSQFSLEWLNIFEILYKRTVFFEKFKTPRLITLSRIDMINQYIINIEKIKEYYPTEKTLVLKMQDNMIRECVILLSNFGYLNKKIKLLFRVFFCLLRNRILLVREHEQ